MTVTCLAELARNALRLFQTQAHARRGRAFCAIRRATARAEHRHQGFARFAAHRTIGLYRSKARRRRVTLVTLITRRSLLTGRPLLSGQALVSGSALLAWRALRSLWSLRAGLALGTGDALNTLGALWSRRTLRTRLTLRTLRSGIPAASPERKRKANDEYRNDSHDVPPDD
jgi:hypothetical protein